MEENVKGKKENTAILRGTIRFINETDGSHGKKIITVAVTPNSKTEAENIGIPVKHNEYDGNIYELVHFNVYDNTRIYDADGEYKFSDHALRYGDDISVKVAPREYTYMGKKGISCRLIGLYVNEYSRRGGFTDEELAILRASEEDLL